MQNRTNPELAMRVWLRLIRLEARMQAAVSDRLRLIGVSIPQCDVLTTLSEQEGVNQQELAKRLYVTKGNISGLLDRLEAARFVERRSLASDRRQYSIHLTDAGRMMAEKAIVVQKKWLASTLGRLDETELEALEVHLLRLRDVMRAHEPSQHARAVGA